MIAILITIDASKVEGQVRKEGDISAFDQEIFELIQDYLSGPIAKKLFEAYPGGQLYTKDT